MGSDLMRAAVLVSDQGFGLNIWGAPDGETGIHVRLSRSEEPF